MSNEIPDFFKTRSFISRMGVDTLEVAQSCCIDPAEFDMPPAKIRSRIAPYGAYHGKKFVTRIKDGKIYVYRTE